MGIFDKAKDLLSEHHDKVDAGIDKAGDLINQRTGGQHADQIGNASQQAKAKLDEFSGPVPAAADPTTHDEPIARPDPGQPTGSTAPPQQPPGPA